MIEPTDEMRAVVKRRMGVADGDQLDPWMDAAIGDVLAIVARDRCLEQRHVFHPLTKPAPAPFAPTVDPCTGCGDAEADHGERGCDGDFGHCPCETWMPLTESPVGRTREGLLRD